MGDLSPTLFASIILFSREAFPQELLSQALHLVNHIQLMMLRTVAFIHARSLCGRAQAVFLVYIVHCHPFDSCEVCFVIVLTSQVKQWNLREVS